MAPSRHPASLALLLGGLLLHVAPLGAQERVAGTVLDSASGRPVPDVALTVLGTRFRGRSDAEGRFRLQVPRESVVVEARRLGYAAQSVVLPPASRREGELVIRLRPRATRLSGISIEDDAAPPLAQTVTPATMRQLPPLVEPDVFRAIAFLPGVLQPNDLRGRLTMAGGRSDETGMRLNGHPLQNPFHAAELLSSFNVASLERADVRIHHLGAEYADRLSGVVDLTTRRPRERPAGEVVTSLLATSFTTSQPRIPGGFALLASGRVTYVDKALKTFYSDSALHDVPLYGFMDGTVAIERSWEGGTRLELTGFGTHDAADEIQREGRPGNTPYGWGEWMLGASLGRTGGAFGWRTRLSIDQGGASFRDVREGYGGVDRTQVIDTWSERLSATGALEWRRASWELATGLTADRLRVRHAWHNVNDRFNSLIGPPDYVGGGTRMGGSLFATFGATPAPEWTLGADAKLWLGSDGAHPAPALWVRRRLGPTLRMEGAIERRLQFDTELGEPQIGFGRAPVFPITRARIADVAALSADWTPAARAGGDDEPPAQLRAQAFFKRYTDRTRLQVPDTAGGTYGYGQIMWPGFPVFVRAPGRSYGAMLSGRALVGRRLLLQGQYTLQRALETQDGVESPTDWDAPHQGAGLASLLLGRWTLNAAGQLRSGLAVTGVRMRLIDPYPGGGFGQRYVMDSIRNTVRLPPYARVDLGLRRTWGQKREWTFAFQLQNVFFRWNASGYDWPAYFDARRRGRAGAADDALERISLPIIPSLGLEVRW